MKNENQIWADIITAINAGIADRGIAGFTVQAGSQPTKATISGPTIWIERVSSKRYGAQSRLPEVVDGLLIETETYYQEIMVQVTARKHRNPQTDTVDTQTSGDAMNMLVSYFNGRWGMEKLVSLGFKSLRATDVRELAPMGDSDTFAKTPSFDLTLTHIQTDIRALPSVDGATYSIYNKFTTEETDYEKTVERDYTLDIDGNKVFTS